MEISLVITHEQGILINSLGLGSLELTLEKFP
jgi:hypothetical protein